MELFAVSKFWVLIEEDRGSNGRGEREKWRRERGGKVTVGCKEKERG